MSAKEDSNYKWKSILGNFIDDKFLSGKHGPCPICGGKDRFRFEPESERGSYFCSHCGSGTGIYLLAQILRIDFHEAWKKVEGVIGTSVIAKKSKPEDRTAYILSILKIAHPAALNNNVVKYLKSRGIQNNSTQLLAADTAPSKSIMIGRFAINGKLKGLHLTYICDGKKDQSADKQKRMLAKEKGALTGSAIYIHTADSKLIIAEGIETALSASELFGWPAWATGSAILMESVKIHDAVKDVMICGDNDESFTGQASAYALAKRLKNEGKNVTVVFPNQTGKDWNDVIQEKNISR